MNAKQRDEIHMQRGPEIMPPKRVVIAVKQILGLPVFAIVRFPVPGGKFGYTTRRIA